MATTLSGVVVFVVSLLVGGAAIYAGALVALKGRDYTHAVVTALLGALAWTGVEVALAWADVNVGSLASLLALVVWVGVVKYRYDAGWLRAALIGVFAWVAALVALAVLGPLGVPGIDAYGVPGA
ncbi:hypothetical protein G9C85_13350 [Halorubellus sp. JP-L1]|uniref:hypothetical protein n=1 Tax=Halorubellus sp. JP-L1 TaxID=2715753 RepID=UPI00140889C0|nr:hypothetical protein [Halorubellus sp. JP-L1]NHN42607.1 hypothetical protein [Halorubellus sp. JP-L1]